MIIEKNIHCRQFGYDNEMFINISGYLNIDAVIRLRNFLTSEIERVQQPVVDMLQKVNGNASPEIENIELPVDIRKTAENYKYKLMQEYYPVFASDDDGKYRTARMDFSLGFDKAVSFLESLKK